MTSSGDQSLFGIAMRRPAASGRGKRACAAFFGAREWILGSGKGATFSAAMSTCNGMFSEVADTQPSVA
jgi:hypothetical protein